MYAARFETLIGHHTALDERRRRMMSSALMAAVLSMGAGTAAYVADHLGVTAVAPPSNAYQVTLSVFEAPPPPETPQSPKHEGAAAAADDDPPPEEPMQSEPDPAPLDTPSLDPSKPSARVPSGSSRAGSSDSGGAKGSSIFGGGGTGTCLPPCVGSGTPSIGTWRPPTPAAPKGEPRKEPIKAAMARAISTPNPDQTALARTTTGQGLRRGGQSSVSFCIDKRGHTFDVRTSRAFGGDTEIDRICRNAVSRWRFKAMRVGNEARITCTTTTFEIHFD